MAVDKAAIGKFMDLRKQGYDRCMYLDFKCEGDAIRAHSVQNGKVLDRLQKDNHVIIPKPKFDPAKGPSFELGLIGRNKALTFTGLCSAHDTELFKLADTLPLDINNKKQLEQYGYRAVMKELHTCIEEGTRFYALDADQVKKGLVKPGEGGAGQMAVFFSDRAWRLFRYRSQNFDTPILEGKDLPIEHRIITFDGQKPTLAVSSFFGVGSEKNGDTIGVMLSVVPEDAKTTAVLSYATAQKDAVKKALPELFEDKADHKKALSYTILQRVENFTLAPAFYDGWSADKKRKVVEYFNESLQSGKPPPKDAEFSLFTLNASAANTSYLLSLAEQMSNLTVSEAAALSKQLQDKWNVLS
jgi:hypothetical protein